MELVGITILVGTALFACTYGKKRFPGRALQSYKVTSKTKPDQCTEEQINNINVEKERTNTS